jgi:hypothetical protein
MRNTPYRGAYRFVPRRGSWIPYSESRSDPWSTRSTPFRGISRRRRGSIHRRPTDITLPTSFPAVNLLHVIPKCVTRIELPTNSRARVLPKKQPSLSPTSETNKKPNTVTTRRRYAPSSTMYGFEEYVIDVPDPEQVSVTLPNAKHYYSHFTFTARRSRTANATRFRFWTQNSYFFPILVTPKRRKTRGGLMRSGTSSGRSTPKWRRRVSSTRAKSWRSR